MRSQEGPGGARRSQEGPGELGGAWEEFGGAPPKKEPGGTLEVVEALGAPRSRPRLKGV